jgi:anthranilate/para-aminobenzoate synthase component II
MRRDDRLLYSFQFHPEDYSDTFPAGRILLERFFDLAKSC